MDRGREKRVGGRNRRLRVLFVLAVCIGALAAAESGSAAISWTGAEAEDAVTTSGCDPCVFVFVERYGAGRVVSDAKTAEDVPLDCGTRCNGDFATWNPPSGNGIVLTATPVADFRGWVGCPPGGQSHNVCTVPLDGSLYCLKAYFGSEGTPLSAGGCPPPGLPPPPPPPQTPPPPKAICELTGSARGNVIRGNWTNDSICGRGGNDRLYGAGGADLLRGQAGGDKLYGNAGNDKLYGNDGNDVLVGGRGRDLHDGGAGRDVIQARDRVRDTVRCGRGRDVVYADRADRVARDCDVVRRTRR